MAQEYLILEGTPYSKFAIPIEYPPSRDLQPRWGYSKPRIAVLDDWFRAHSGAYWELLSSMRPVAQGLASIPMEFNEKALPSPAWFEVPYSPFDAVALCTLIKRYRPAHYLEIGSGISTCFARHAIKSEGLTTKITSIDPQPRAQIDTICDAVIREGLETCDLSIFENLIAGDILFFDGSHRSFMNSDVTVFMIDVLPRLRPGVIVHIHDISLPWDYDTSFKNWYWNEQYLLAVYMMGNRHRLDPVLPTAFVCRDAEFKKFFDVPLLDFGTRNDGWRGGGAMWFTHR